MNDKILNLIKQAVKNSGFFTVKYQDTKLTADLKSRFDHQDRSFVYGWRKLLVDSLYCHASPGVLETMATELKQALEQAPAGNKLLNLGGGTGQVAAIYRWLGFDVYNLDIAVEKEDERNKKYDLNQAGPLPYQGGFFDLVVCSEIIEHLENPWKLFRQAEQVLKPGGIFILSTPNVLSLHSRLLYFFSGYFKWFTPDCFSYHINPVFLWEIRHIASHIGFREVKLLGNGDFFFPGRAEREKSVVSRNEELIMIFQK